MSRRKPSNPRRKKKERPVSNRARNTALNRIRGVVGAAVLNAARDKFGDRKVGDLAQVLARELSKKKQQQIRKERGQKSGLPLTKLDKERHKILKQVNSRRGPEVRFFRRKDGKYDKWERGRRVGVATEKQKKRFEISRPYWKFVRLTSGTLDISPKEARHLISEVAKQSQEKLKKFKNSRAFKKMSARRRRRYTKERTRLNALLRFGMLLNGPGGSDPVGLRLVRGGKDE